MSADRRANAVSAPFRVRAAGPNQSCRARHFPFNSDRYARPFFTASPDFSCIRFVGLDSGHISNTFLVSLDCRQSFQPCDKIG